MRFQRQRLFQAGFLGEYEENTFDWIGYADDVFLTFEDSSNLNKALQLLNEVLDFQ